MKYRGCGTARLVFLLAGLVFLASAQSEDYPMTTFRMLSMSSKAMGRSMSDSISTESSSKKRKQSPKNSKGSSRSTSSKNTKNESRGKGQQMSSRSKSKKSLPSRTKGSKSLSSKSSSKSTKVFSDIDSPKKKKTRSPKESSKASRLRKSKKDRDTPEGDIVVPSNPTIMPSSEFRSKSPEPSSTADVPSKAPTSAASESQRTNEPTGGPIAAPIATTMPSPAAECGVQSFQGECTTTRGCRDIYADAVDCSNSQGGVCLCPDEQVCGCRDGLPPIAPPPPVTPPPLIDPSCGKDDFQSECTTTGFCKSIYPDAFDCKNNQGGVCYCGDNEVCGCIQNVTLAPAVPSPEPSVPPSISPAPTSACGVQSFQGECTTTRGCRDTYADAVDCSNSQGGVCLCPDEQVCGCRDGLPPIAPPPLVTPPPLIDPSCGKDDFQRECTTTGFCKSIYPDAFDCKNNQGGVCYCGDNEVCGCIQNVTLAPAVPSPEPSVPPSISPAPTSACGVQSFQGECTTTRGCRDTYADAVDCNNSQGGVCLCPDEQVCGCR